MACIDHIWFHGSGKPNTIRVCIKLKPSGAADIDVNLPVKFYKVIMDIAQTAADNHEALCRAAILGDNHSEDKLDMVTQAKEE